MDKTADGCPTDVPSASSLSDSSEPSAPASSAIRFADSGIWGFHLRDSAGNSHNIQLGDYITCTCNRFQHGDQQHTNQGICQGIQSLVERWRITEYEIMNGSISNPFLELECICYRPLERWEGRSSGRQWLFCSICLKPVHTTCWAQQLAIRKSDNEETPVCPHCRSGTIAPPLPDDDASDDYKSQDILDKLESIYQDALLFPGLVDSRRGDRAIEDAIRCLHYIPTSSFNQAIDFLSKRLGVDQCLLERVKNTPQPAQALCDIVKQALRVQRKRDVWTDDLFYHFSYCVAG
jgi:hypothetical protein